MLVTIPPPCQSPSVRPAATSSNVLGLSGSATALWNGQTVDSTCVLLKYTYAGDANLDGVVNLDDYSNIDGSVAIGGPTKDYFDGDFNYDGNIDLDDYAAIDGNMQTQGGPL